MRITSILLCAMASAALAAPALADPPATNPTATTPTAQAPAAKPQKRQPKPDDMICEEDASVTGSILSHRVCKTRAQREAESQSGQDQLRANARQVPGAGRP